MRRVYIRITAREGISVSNSPIPCFITFLDRAKSEIFITFNIKVLLNWPVIFTCCVFQFLVTMFFIVPWIESAGLLTTFRIFIVSSLENTIYNSYVLYTNKFCREQVWIYREMRSLLGWKSWSILAEWKWKQNKNVWILSQHCGLAHNSPTSQV